MRSAIAKSGEAAVRFVPDADSHVDFSADPRCHMLGVILLAGYSLRAMNHMRVSVPSGLNGALALLHILFCEREARHDERSSSPKNTSAGPLESRSVLAITASIDVPRETVRRILLGLASDGLLHLGPQGSYETSASARRRFSVEENPSQLADFVWTAHELVASLTVRGDAIDALMARHPFNTSLATRRESLVDPAHAAMMPLVLDWLRSSTGSDKQRAARVVDGYLYRHLKRMRAAFGDLLLPLILGEIAHRNVSRLAHRGNTAKTVQHLGGNFGTGVPAPVDDFMGINAHSLSLSMGVPDATLRRKLTLLRTRGWIGFESDGNLVVKGEAVRRQADMANREALRDMIAGYRGLVGMGIAS